MQKKQNGNCGIKRISLGQYKDLQGDQRWFVFTWFRRSLTQIGPSLNFHAYQCMQQQSCWTVALFSHTVCGWSRAGTPFLALQTMRKMMEALSIILALPIGSLPGSVPQYIKAAPFRHLNQQSQLASPILFSPNFLSESR